MNINDNEGCLKGGGEVIYKYSTTEKQTWKDGGINPLCALIGFLCVIDVQIQKKYNFITYQYDQDWSMMVILFVSDVHVDLFHYAIEKQKEEIFFSL